MILFLTTAIPEQFADLDEEVEIEFSDKGITFMTKLMFQFAVQ